MSTHIVKKYDQQLNKIRTMILEMGGLVVQQITDAIRAVEEEDTELAMIVIEQDKMVNRMDVLIEKEATELMALRAPLAGDLRLTMSIAKATTDLERIGDEARKIARMLININKTDEAARFSAELLRDVLSMAKFAIVMLNQALDSFARQDEVLAKETMKMDDQLDHYFHDGMRRLITYMMEDPRKISISLDVVFVLKAIERIGDHSKNIVEYVLYMVHGESVRLVEDA